MAQEKYPITNLEYDIISVLQSKLEGIAAYTKFIEDARRENNRECEQMFSELMEQDRQHAERLRSVLAGYISQSGQPSTQPQRTAQRGMTGQA